MVEQWNPNSVYLWKTQPASQNQESVKIKAGTWKWRSSLRGPPPHGGQAPLPDSALLPRWSSSCWLMDSPENPAFKSVESCIDSYRQTCPGGNYYLQREWNQQLRWRCTQAKIFFKKTAHFGLVFCSVNLWKVTFHKIGTPLKFNTNTSSSLLYLPADFCKSKHYYCLQYLALKTLHNLASLLWSVVCPLWPGLTVSFF